MKGAGNGPLAWNTSIVNVKVSEEELRREFPGNTTVQAIAEEETSIKEPGRSGQRDTGRSGPASQASGRLQEQVSSGGSTGKGKCKQVGTHLHRQHNGRAITVQCVLKRFPLWL